MDRIRPLCAFLLTLLLFASPASGYLDLLTTASYITVPIAPFFNTLNKLPMSVIWKLRVTDYLTGNGSIVGANSKLFDSQSGDTKQNSCPPDGAICTSGGWSLALTQTSGISSLPPAYTTAGHVTTACSNQPAAESWANKYTDYTFIVVVEANGVFGLYVNGGKPIFTSQMGFVETTAAIGTDEVNQVLFLRGIVGRLYEITIWQGALNAGSMAPYLLPAQVPLNATGLLWRYDFTMQSSGEVVQAESQPGKGSGPSALIRGSYNTDYGWVTAPAPWAPTPSPFPTPSPTLSLTPDVTTTAPPRTSPSPSPSPSSPAPSAPPLCTLGSCTNANVTGNTTQVTSVSLPAVSEPVPVDGNLEILEQLKLIPSNALNGVLAVAGVLTVAPGANLVIVLNDTIIPSSNLVIPIATAAEIHGTFASVVVTPSAQQRTCSKVTGSLAGDNTHLSVLISVDDKKCGKSHAAWVIPVAVVASVVGLALIVLVVLLLLRNVDAVKPIFRRQAHRRRV